MSIKIKTRNVGRSADLWGYTLRVNGKFLQMDFDGYINTPSVRMCNAIEQATVFTNITSLRQYWNNYRQLIVFYSQQS